MSKRIVIVSGGKLEEEFVLSLLTKEENQNIIGVDKGLSLIHICARTGKMPWNSKINLKKTELMLL